MPPQMRLFAAGVGACAVLFTAVPAQAGEVLAVDGPRAVSVHDPLVPSRAESSLGREPGATQLGRSPAAAAASAAGKPPAAKRRATRGERAVARALRAAVRARRISRGRYRAYTRLYGLARGRRARISRSRGRELGHVIYTLEQIALSRRLNPSRMRALFLILRRNTEFWRRSPFPASGTRVRFRGSRLLFEYYPGRGLQLQPLVNFKQANLMHGACVKRTGPCERDGLRRLLNEMIATSTTRGGFRAWEYYFEFGGGIPPWMSGMAQATGIQAFGRASQLLDAPGFRRYATEALPAFETAPPVGVATTGPLGGTHYLQYSFAPRLFIINAFLQSVIGLYDYSDITGDPTARRLWQSAEPTARLELPRNDTGDWSTYSYGGRESTLEYHLLLTEFASSLCSRLRAPVYCTTARRFRDYMTEPAELELLGPATATKGRPARVSFSLSKLSAVQITITRDGQVATDRTATFRRGTGSFDFTPGGTGTYSVRLAAKELRTGRGLRTRTSGELESLPAG